MKFLGNEYTLNQCEDIFKWFKDSKVGECTNYYDKVVFHTEGGFFAAYKNNLNNYVAV